LYDASGWTPSGTSRVLQRFLTASWAVGTKLFPGTAIGATSWRDALDELLDHQADNGPIRELHVWGHGSRGNPAIGNVDRLDIQQFRRSLPELQVVWWRSCSVHADRHWTERFVNETGVVSVGHCVMITWPNPMYQNAVCGLRPGESAHWVRTGRRQWVSTAHDKQPLPNVSTFRKAIPYGKTTAWRLFHE
jgi:hypothetical protein